LLEAAAADIQSLVFELTTTLALHKCCFASGFNFSLQSCMLLLLIAIKKCLFTQPRGFVLNFAAASTSEYFHTESFAILLFAFMALHFPINSNEWVAMGA